MTEQAKSAEVREALQQAANTQKRGGTATVKTKHWSDALTSRNGGL
ncbi:MAG: hypothetical protein ACREGJ_01590 [Candidatus Saccharimonadales bacterium]